jgi:ribonuclease-3
MLNNPNALSLLFKKFGIEPKAPSLYVQAFTHVSYSTQHKNNINYERLEFLGDAVLDKLISAFLYREYPDMTSGELSTTHSLMTKGKTLTIAAERLGFKDLIIIGGTMRSNDDISPRILEDVFEAFIGAVFLDQGEAKV